MYLPRWSSLRGVWEGGVITLFYYLVGAFWLILILSFYSPMKFIMPLLNHEFRLTHSALPMAWFRFRLIS